MTKLNYDVTNRLQKILHWKQLWVSLSRYITLPSLLLHFIKRQKVLPYILIFSCKVKVCNPKRLSWLSLLELPPIGVRNQTEVMWHSLETIRRSEVIYLCIRVLNGVKYGMDCKTISDRCKRWVQVGLTDILPIEESVEKLDLHLPRWENKMVFKVLEKFYINL